ncbi:MAG TPA: mannose-1-phosphate guanylyltransferase [Terriglobales bacterium]|jgi:mannose-1-phosphate guanylyltransferase|nr:mannose-1-phosphate guanylyltransferase [Terriglobales bacterium]
MPANFYPVILAGGRGTRFWPLSRKKRAKQLLALDGKETMIQQTVARLLPLAAANKFWIITNEDLRPEIVRQLKKLKSEHIIAEPMGRNTAPAIGLAAFILRRNNPDAVIGLFPSDHVIGNEVRFREILSEGIEIAAAGENIVVLGIEPSRAETGYGYIEAGSLSSGNARHVLRFTEKPNAERAAEFVRSGNFYWNSGIFLWSAKTLTTALTEHLPKTAALLEKIAADFGTRKFAATFKRLYPKCEDISIDYAVLEPRSAKGEQESNIFCLRADFGWNDLGSWTALHEHHVGKSTPADGNLISSQGIFTLNASGNYVHAPHKFVAVVGVNDVVVVETEDALLVTTRANSQDVGKVVKFLDEKKLKKLV